MRQVNATLHRKSVRRRLIKTAFLSVNVLVLAAVIGLVFQSRTNGNQAVFQSSAPEASPLDQVSSADIALTVSRLSGMSEATAVKNQSESEDVKLAAAPVSNNVVSKPQVVATAFKSYKDIQSYTTQAGDTVPSLAAKFNVSSDSIRWSNSLTGDTIGANIQLKIPPVGYSGIVYTVKAGDTLDTIASKYKADKSVLITANDAEIKGLSVGQTIIIPGGTQPVVQAYTASASSSFAWGTSAIYGSYNGYDRGYCTWYVANRRADVGMPLPSNLGNASSWGYIAKAAGLPTGNTPKQYAAVVTSTRGEGHVAFVESVNPDGSVNISQMNTAGWNVRSTATISADQATQYTYIY